MTKDIAIDMTVDFFKDRWIHGDESRARFAALLREHLCKATEETHLWVDYDPMDDLLPLVRAAGVPCSGCLFSAREIFDGTKFGVWFNPKNKTAEFKLSYGTFGEKLNW